MVERPDGMAAHNSMDGKVGNSAGHECEIGREEPPATSSLLFPLAAQRVLPACCAISWFPPFVPAVLAFARISIRSCGAVPTARPFFMKLIFDAHLDLSMNAVE